MELDPVMDQYERLKGSIPTEARVLFDTLVDAVKKQMELLEDQQELLNRQSALIDHQGKLLAEQEKKLRKTSRRR